MLFLPLFFTFKVFCTHKLVILGIFICAVFICNIACGDGTSIGGITHRKTKLSDMYGYEANEHKRARKDAVQVLAPNNTQALGTDSSSFTTEYAKEDDPNDSEMITYKAYCVNLLKFVSNGCDPLWLNGTLCQDEMQISNKESDGETLQESKGANECNNSKESCIENTAASPDQYLDDTTRTIHGINNPTAVENTKSNQDQGLNVNVDSTVPKNIPTNNSVENHVAESLPNLEKTHGTDVPQTASKTPRGDGIEFSYLSFGVNSSIPSFYTCVINAEERISSLDKSTNSADDTMSIVDQNHAKYAFSRIIDIKNSENNILETMIKKEILFGSIEEMVGKVKTKSMDLDELVNVSKNYESLYVFFENLNVKDYSCKIIQDLYFLFITYNCLEYNLFLKCWVLREELWEAHAYMSELYPYALWKMEKINTENEITLKNREIYKQNLKEELKLLCIILELYREIKILNIKPDSCSKHQSLINMHIEKLRKLIQKHLESFYASERATSLYYIASKLSNNNVPQYNLDRIQNLYLIDGRFLGLTKQLTAHSNLPVKETYSWLQQKQSELAFIYDVNQVNIYKIILPILGFTVNFASKGLQISDLKTIKSKEVENGKKMPPYRLLQSCVFNLNQRIEAFESTLIDWLCFIKLIREKHFNQKSDGTHDSDKFGILQFKCAMDEYNLAGILTQPQRLILLRNMIKRVLSIKL